MDPFITNCQYNFIAYQAKNIVKAIHSVNDQAVKDAFIYSCLEKSIQLFPDINHEQRTLISQMIQVNSEVKLNDYLRSLSPFCISFPKMSDKGIKKLFRKVKKLNYPSIEEEAIKHLTYFSWNDAGSDKKFMIKELDNKLIGIYGRLVPLNKKSICHFCHQHTEVGLFTVEVKKKGDNMNFKALGNYVCVDSVKCNEEIKNDHAINEFFRSIVN